VIMKHKILSWNVRGLNDRDKCMRISNLLSFFFLISNVVYIKKRKAPLSTQ
jgi:hypothetical protein